MRRIIQLDTEKIRRMLEDMKRTQVWLSNKVNIDRQLLFYDLQTGCPNRVDLYADVFNMETKDLIK
jgi:hypothetical protein